MTKALFLFLGALISLSVAVLISFFMISNEFPSVDSIKGCLTTELFKVRLCPGSPSYARISEISSFMKSAVIVSEDSSFYSHDGLDYQEIKESFEKNLSRFSYARGGSTITQQLAKNVYLNKEKSIIRKLKEAYLAEEKIEELLSKDEILERYLNVVQFGKNIFGIRTASEYYFGKSPSDLSVLESAFLTFLLPGPEKYSISFEKKQLSQFARQRILDICRKLEATGRITEEQYQFARANIDRFPWKGELVVPAPGIHVEEPEMIPEQDYSPSDEEAPDDSIYEEPTDLKDPSNNED